MFSPVKVFIALGGLGLGLMVPTAAQAEWRFPFFYQPHYDTYYPGPDRFYDPYYDDEEDYFPPPRRQRYGQPRNSYYDSQRDEWIYVKPRKKKTTRVAPQKDLTQRKSVATASRKPAASPTRQASAGMSCDRASKVISGYGFSSVTASSCSGATYAFNATRGGKAYLIRLNAANGELTEVRKVQ